MKRRQSKTEIINELIYQNYRFKKALKHLIESIELENCFYCPIGCKDDCPYKDGSKECYKKIYDYFMEKRSNNGN